MSQIIISKSDIPATSVTIPSYDVIFPNSILLLAPRCMLQPDLAMASFSVEKLNHATYRTTKHACCGHTSPINFQITIQNGDFLSCNVRRIFKEGDIVETYAVELKDGGFVFAGGEIGLVGKIEAYEEENMKRDSFLALITGAFILELVNIEVEDKDDRQAMVESEEAWDWESVEHVA